MRSVTLKKAGGTRVARTLSVTAAAVLLCSLSAAQSNTRSRDQADDVSVPQVLNFAALAQRAEALLKQAREGDGSAALALAKYSGHYTMLTARTRSGAAEVHQHFADFLFVIAGAGTELTGGTVVDPKASTNGETRGARLEGATSHTLHRGDVIHIPAGTPHQAIEAPGQSITIYVVKVEEPAMTTPR